MSSNRQARTHSVGLAKTLGSKDLAALKGSKINSDKEVGLDSNKVKVEHPSETFSMNLKSFSGVNREEVRGEEDSKNQPKRERTLFSQSKLTF